MKIYSITKNGDFKFKKEINENNYQFSDCKGSAGIEIKHKKNGKKLYLSTKETFEYYKNEYDKTIKRVGKTFSHITDENDVKLRDEKGKLLRRYTSQEDANEYLDCALSCNYINFDDFVELYNRKHLED
jgi:hypothetical protein